MLKSLVQSQLSTNFILIQDTEDERGQDLFVAFLKNHNECPEVKNINLICIENPPEFYLSILKMGNSKITIFNYFEDPYGWNSSCSPTIDLSEFFSKDLDLSETVFFIDSLSFLVTYKGFCNVYRFLNSLKKSSKKVICYAHRDLFDESHLEDLKFLSRTLLKLEDGCQNDRIIKVLYRKPGGKIISQQEVFSISQDFRVSSQVKEDKKVVKTSANPEDDIENLTTFKLGLKLNESEKKAKSELVLPYLKSENKTSGGGEILYFQEVEDDLEDDPDDDLDI